MTSEQLAQMTYEEKEARLDQILSRLDNSQTPMDELAQEAKEAAQLLMSMHETLKAARQEITDVFTEMERQKDAVSLATRSELASVDGKGA